MPTSSQETRVSPPPAVFGSKQRAHPSGQTPVYVTSGLFFYARLGFLNTSMTLDDESQAVALARHYSPLGKIPRGYYLSASRTIKDKNNTSVRGLFTSRSIKKGDLIGEYRGPRVNHAQTQAKTRNTQYFFGVFGNDKASRKNRLKFVIDGGNARRSSFLRYVNAPNHSTQANARFVQVQDRILLYATKTIRPQTELLAWYGPHTRQIIEQH